MSERPNRESCGYLGCPHPSDCKHIPREPVVDASEHRRVLKAKEEAEREAKRQFDLANRAGESVLSLRAQLAEVRHERDEARKDAGNHAVAGRLLRESLAAKESQLAEVRGREEGFREEVETLVSLVEMVPDFTDPGEPDAFAALYIVKESLAQWRNNRAALSSPASEGVETRKRCGRKHACLGCPDCRPAPASGVEQEEEQ